MSTAAQPRLAPRPREEWDDAVRDALRAAFSDAVAARFFGDGGDAAPMPTVLGTLMHHPSLAGPFLAYNNVLLTKPTIGHRVRELAVLRVAWRTRALYEWAQHVRLAEKVGVSAAEIEVIARADAADDDVWSPLEADVLRATDECIDRHRIGADTWARLATALDEPQLVELVFVIGTYVGLAFAFNSFGLQLDADLREMAIPARYEFEE